MTSNKTFMSFDDLGVEPPHAGDGEPAFRRGYHHGAIYVVRAIKAGVPVDDLEQFVEGAVREWRNHHTTPSYPPALAKKGE